MKDCVFCEIVRHSVPARLVFKTENTLAFLPDVPAVMGHTLVIPRAHVPDIWGLSGDQAASIARDVRTVADLVRVAFEPDGLNLIQSNGGVAGQSVFHLHVHVVPRTVDDRMPELWPPDKKWDPAVLDLMARQLRSVQS